LFSVVIAIALVALALWQVDLRSFAASLTQVNHVMYLLFMFLFVIALLVADSLAIAHVYVRYVCRVTFREIVTLRGASYLPSLINYHVGQAWLTWFASRTYGAKLARVAGATLLNYVTMFGSLAIFAAVAYPLSAARIPWLGSTLVVLAVCALGYAVVILTQPALLKRVPGFEMLFDAGLAGHFWALMWRLPHMFVLFLGMWLPFRFFSVQIPMGDALAYVPILMLVGALPITPQGVGTRDVIALNLLAAYAPGSAGANRIAAATLCWAVSITLVEGLISPVFLISARRLFGKAAPNAPLRFGR
jgi:hypothetical protein